MNIPLGYEIGSGRRVTIPVNHTVVLGQTQLSGKTTTLEAMVTRSGLRAVGFITKPGEKSFRQQTQIPAFFTESTTTDYWKYVASIVENLMSVKLGWQERGWIVKLCQEYEREGKTKKQGYEWDRPTSLRELLDNVEIALPHLRGNAEMVCMQLREYLKAVVREIDRTYFSAKLELEPGINVMDVTELSDGLKALVIRSVIEHVHRHGRKIVVIIPEAWKFIPEGRSTPVKLALEGLIREGAGVGNFVWMDSQDLRGVDKLLLRSVIVWLFGVQRQKNEVASTLASIPDHPKPTATEIMQLGKGEFYVCYGQTLVRTYVQPAGMEDAHAQAIARGEESPDSWRQISKALDEENSEMGSHPESQGKDPELRGESGDPGAADVDLPFRNYGGAAPEPTGSDREALSTGEIRLAAADVEELPDEVSPAQQNLVIESEDDPMLKMKAPNPTPITERFRDYLKTHTVTNDLIDNLVPLLAEYDRLVEAHDAMAERVRQLEAVDGSRRLLKSSQDGETTLEGRLPASGTDHTVRTGGETGAGSTWSPPRINGAGEPSSPAPHKIVTTFPSMDFLYAQIKERASKDPGILELLARRPELRVTIERQTIEVDGGTLRGVLALLISRKFFDSPQNGNTAFNELKRLGKAVAKPNVYRELDKLAELGFVTKEETGYQAVAGMKVHIVESGKAAAAR